MGARRAAQLTLPRLLHRPNIALSRLHISSPHVVPSRQILRISVRHASSASSAPTSTAYRLRNFFYGSTLLATLLLGYYAVTDVRFSAHRWLTVPLLRVLYRDDAEQAHHAGIRGLRALGLLGLGPRERRGEGREEEGDLGVEVFGHKLLNPVGTSAGIDKGAEVPDELLFLGSAYVEVGGITPLPQDGNSKPRLFRIPSQNALINRFGLNSEGADRVARRLRERVRSYAYHRGYGIDEEAERMVLNGEAGVPPGSLVKGKLMGVQIAKNKATPDDIEAVANDYVYCVEKLSKYADVIVVNVSSPNTENLRDLQRQEPLTRILQAVVGAAQKTDRKTKPAVMVKVSPDEDSEEQVDGICRAIWDSGVDGVIVGNTTKRRPDPLPIGAKLSPVEEKTLQEQGGYSGPQLFERTVSLVKRYRQTLDQFGDDPKPSPQSKEFHEKDSSFLIKSTEDARSQPPFHLPSASSSASSSASHDTTAIPTIPAARKIIFCSGGITNGKQALEALNAGADMIQIYTALIYGGVGTIARIKDEMRAEMRGRK